MNGALTRALLALSLIALPAAPATRAQEPPVGGRTARIGVVFSSAALLHVTGPAPSNANAKALREGLQERGLVDGKNVQIAWRSAEGRFDRIPAIIEELARLPVDVLVVGGNPSVRAAVQVTRTVPIVMWGSAYPVEEGLVASLAKPGGNLTGLLFDTGGEADARRLALLKDAAPKVSRVALIGPRDAGDRLLAPEVRAAAGALALTTFSVTATSGDQLERAFAEALRSHADGVFIVDSHDAWETSHMQVVQALAVRHRLPAVHGVVGAADWGLMLVHGADVAENFRRAAFYVDRILKGARPGDLPIERPRAFRTIVNLRTARAIGLAIPASAVAKADRVIE